ncbi:hypothetical protein EJ02DRAFT_451720 [Clathrospora elynae]|uniref:Uncharacterized protein n=1 Tax=Clathrospora elynae TaxID=706981 RepID=A0A6A5T846_9PLEO|nr:hypothetical protein EJ02DRAFT_451720 [Clathrospora elynae]
MVATSLMPFLPGREPGIIQLLLDTQHSTSNTQRLPLHSLALCPSNSPILTFIVTVTVAIFILIIIVTITITTSCTNSTSPLTSHSPPTRPTHEHRIISAGGTASLSATKRTVAHSVSH